MGKNQKQDPIELEVLGSSSALAGRENAPATSKDNDKDDNNDGNTSSSTVQDGVLYPELSTPRAVVVCLSVAGITFVSSMTTGLLATGLPKIASSINISEALILWPASIFGLTGGCTFIPIASVADIIGSRPVHLFGCLFLSLCILACGLAKTPTTLIVFRGIQGVAASCCLPTAISILTETFPQGRQRTRGLAIQGAAMPLGYSVGLLLGGLFADTIGWRWGWYIASILSIVVFVAGLWAIPYRHKPLQYPWKQVMTHVDWLGALLASTCLGLISYVLAVTASRRSNISHPQNIVLLTIAGLLIPAFIYWMQRQENRGKPALIPNSVWSNRYFTSICVMMFIVSAVLNAGEFFFSLFFQKVQNLSALQASLRYLPSVIIGVILSFVTEAILHRWSTHYYVTAMSSVSALAPLFMALMKPTWSYWYMAFWAMSFAPFANDVLFIVGAVVITNSFSNTKQALAGSILNTLYQFGSAVGLAAMAVISTSVTDEASQNGDNDPGALLQGYRATFWASLACAVVYCLVALWGLRGIGKVGLKRE